MATGRRLELAGIADELDSLALLIDETDAGLVTFGRYRSVAERATGVLALRERLTVPMIELTLSSELNDPLVLLESIDGEVRRCVCFYDLEAALPEVAGILNLRRESLLRVQHALVFWVTEHGLREIATLAPDFWAWRSGVFDFRLGARELGAQIASEAVLQPLEFRDRGELERRASLYRGLVREHQSRSSVDQPALVRALLRLAEAEQRLGNRVAAESATQQAVEGARIANDRVALVPALFRLGHLAQEASRLAEADALFQQAVGLAEQLGDQHSAAVLYHQMGIVAQQRQELELAETLYQRARQVYEKEGAERDAAAIYHQLGNLALSRNELEEAERHYQRALDIERRLGRQPELAAEYLGLGNVALQRGAYDSSGGFLEQARDIYEAFGLEQPATATYHQLGRLAQETGRLEEAESWFQKTLEVSERLGLGRERAGALHQLGRIAQERGDPVASEHWLREALEAGERLGSPGNVAHALAQLGVVLWELGRQEEAFATSGRAYVLAHAREFSIADSIRGNLAEMATALGESRFNEVWRKAFDGQEPPRDLAPFTTR